MTKVLLQTAGKGVDFLVTFIRVDIFIYISVLNLIAILIVLHGCLFCRDLTNFLPLVMSGAPAQQVTSSVWLSVCKYVCLYVCMSVYLSVCLPVFLSFCLLKTQHSSPHFFN